MSMTSGKPALLSLCGILNVNKPTGVTSRAVVDLVSEVDQSVGVVTHRTDDHHNLIALLLGANGLSGSGQNFLRIGDTGPAEFLNDERHEGKG